MTENSGAEKRLAIVGLGYVGLPLAVAFGHRMDVVGYDISAERVEELGKGHDRTLEVDSEELAAASRLTFTCDLAKIRDCSVFIITVPTPIDTARRPDF